MLLTTKGRIQDSTCTALGLFSLVLAGCAPPEALPERWAGEFVGTDGQGRSAHGDFHIDNDYVSGRVDGYTKGASVPADLQAIQGEDGATVFSVGADTVIVQIVDEYTVIVRRNGDPLVLDFPSGYIEPASVATNPQLEPTAVSNGVLLLGAGLAVLGCWSWSSIYCTVSGQGTFDYNNGAVFDAFGQYGGGYCAYPCTSPTSSEYCGDGFCNGTESCQSCASDCGSCGGGIAPWVSVAPQTVAKSQDCMVQSLSGFSPNGTATCHPKNQWGDTTFTLNLNSAGAKANQYCPGAGAGVGQYEFWCVDNKTGLSSNHVNFWITE